MARVTSTISQINVKGSLSGRGVKGKLIQGGAFNWAYYWLTRYPSDLSVAQDDVNLVLTWVNNGTADFDYIAVERSPDGITYAEIELITKTLKTYTDDSGLSEGTYYYRLRYKKGTSQYSAYCDPDSSALVLWDEAASTPSALTLVVVNDTTINGSFTINGTGQDGHKIYISTDGVNYTLKGTVTGATASYQATGLTAGTLYYFYVVAYKGSSESTASNIANATTWTEGEAVIKASNTVAWFDSSDLTTITKDGSNLVSLWKDKLLSGRDLIQVNGTNQPLYEVDGILFDGIDNFMKTAGFVYDQPEFIYGVLKQVTWTSNDRLFDGIANGSGELRQTTATPRITAYTTTGSIAFNSEFTVDTFKIVRLLFNGADSKLQINNTDATTGNAGTTSMSGFTIGAHGGNAAFSNIKVKELILRSVADNAANETAIYNYLANKYGFVTI